MSKPPLYARQTFSFAIACNLRSAKFQLGTKSKLVGPRKSGLSGLASHFTVPRHVVRLVHLHFWHYRCTLARSLSLRSLIEVIASGWMISPLLPNQYSTKGQHKKRVIILKFWTLDVLRSILWHSRIGWNSVPISSLALHGGGRMSVNGPVSTFCDESTWELVGLLIPSHPVSFSPSFAVGLLYPYIVTSTS